MNILQIKNSLVENISRLIYLYWKDTGYVIGKRSEIQALWHNLVMCILRNRIKRNVNQISKGFNRLFSLSFPQIADVRKLPLVYAWKLA